jgi:hypothetical protein
MGKISNKNTKYPLTIPRDLKAKLEKIAEKETRSLNNLIMIILKKWVEEHEQ